MAHTPPSRSLPDRRRRSIAAGCAVLVAFACAIPLGGANQTSFVVIQSFRDGVGAVHAANPDVHLTVGRDPAVPDEPVLFVDYPAPTDDPGGRDVRCDAEHRNWSGGRGISFQIKPAHALRLSVSFFDRNRVAYTSWADLKEGVWQPVRIAFDDLKPNPYFQPPDAKLGGPIDVSDVGWIAFAPQDRTSGRLAVARFVVDQ
jgi:hypothetical protein